MTHLNYDEIRAAVLEYVRTHPTGQVPLHLKVFGSYEDQGRQIRDRDREVARQVFHELYLERILIPGAGSNSVGDGLMGWPFYVLTEYGKQVLSAPEYQPHDANGYLSLLKQQIPSVDVDLLRYLDESLQCFQRGTLLASAVMLGCAAEKASLLLIEAFGNAIQDPAKKQKYEKDTDHWMISRKYDALWKRLEPLATGLPRELGEDLHTNLDRVFDLIRTTRNSAGHPTGKKVERDTMRANLILFPSYCRRVYGLIDHFKVTPV
jgi:hypothetical protein